MNWPKRKQRCESTPVVLHTEILGDGEDTFVFIPGLGGTTRYWKSRVKSLQDRHRIVLVDLLGFGQSPKPWAQYSVERQVQELHTVLKLLGTVTLVGHSLGALITVAYSARHPECVKKIVLMGMPYFGSQRKAYRYMRHGPVKGGYLFTNVVLSMVTCIITRRLFGRVLPYILRDVPREVAEDLVKHTWRSSTSSLWEVVYRYDAAEDLRRIPDRTAVVFIHGERDFMAPVAAIERLVETHPGWHLHKLPAVDHHPFLREPDACLFLITTKEDSL